MATLDYRTAPPETDTSEDFSEQAVALAAKLLAAARDQQTPAEAAQAAKLAGMMNDPDGKKLTMLMPDQAFRSQRASRVADQIRHLTERFGVPDYFQPWEKVALRLGNAVGRVAPGLVVPFIIAKLRAETSDVILPAEPERFRGYLEKRRADGTRLNVNQLGEAVLGEGEAQNRLAAYLELLASPDIEYISVKISSVFSQIHLAAYEHTLAEFKARLRKLYREAMRHTYTKPDGTQLPKFVNLDMEEYRDLHLTLNAFMQVLDEPEFHGYRAGIVLQAYLPDAAKAQRVLTDWALARVQAGGAPIKLRIVKGANLAMEQVEASIHGWEQAPYRSKHEVDANFKRMVTYGCQPSRARAVNLGVASHNLFDISYALLLREHYGLQDEVEFEMLEGMANHQARAVQNAANGLLLYAPVVKHKDFHSAIAYLVRRLDENTAKDNFLHDLFALEPGSEAWQEQRDRFLAAYADMQVVADEPNRQQNRATETPTFDAAAPFENEPDTDFSLRANQKWVADVIEHWKHKTIEDIPLQIGGELSNSPRQAAGSFPSKPEQAAYQYALATPEQVDQALNVAVAAQTAWAARPVVERRELLVRCAETFAQRRGDFLGAMCLDGGKTVDQADPEISEAIDFANYYARSFDQDDLEDVTFAAHGVVLVTPPWNFPMAIPAGGALAALMAGNSVIFKPAPEAMLVGWQIVNALWDAGIPREVLQFVPTSDDEVGRGLVTDERVDAVILTGAYETARMFLKWKPSLRLFAETSGKNALIVTGLADHDQAIKDLVKSAFGHAGQKCSAASLGILEAEVYDNPTFRRQLKDAAKSLAVGYAEDLATVVPPVIREPSEKLQQALTTLEPGEEWLLEPQQVNGQPNLWTPGIKLGVQPGSYFHKTECFGPVLGLMRADNLDHAIDLANAVDYGLTSGLHSLDDREIEHWRDRIHAGNAYVNRITTGAVVRRQPFGGWKRSAFGYAKAGGPNYVYSLGTWTDTGANTDALLEKARQSYPAAWAAHFGVEHDPSALLGEANVYRYRRLKRILVHIGAGATQAAIERVLLATAICGVPVVASGETTALPELENWGHVTVSGQGITQLMQDPAYQYWQRVRVLGNLPEAVQETAIETHTPLIEAPVVSEGRLELRHYLLEQATSHTTHRYGNIIAES